MNLLTFRSLKRSSSHQFGKMRTSAMSPFTQGGHCPPGLTPWMKQGGCSRRRSSRLSCSSSSRAVPASLPCGSATPAHRRWRRHQRHLLAIIGALTSSLRQAWGLSSPSVIIFGGFLSPTACPMFTTSVSSRPCLLSVRSTQPCAGSATSAACACTSVIAIGRYWRCRRGRFFYVGIIRHVIGGAARSPNASR